MKPHASIVSLLSYTMTRQEAGSTSRAVTIWVPCLSPLVDTTAVHSLVRLPQQGPRFVQSLTLCLIDGVGVTQAGRPSAGVTSAVGGCLVHAVSIDAVSMLGSTWPQSFRMQPFGPPATFQIEPLHSSTRGRRPPRARLTAKMKLTRGPATWALGSTRVVLRSFYTIQRSYYTIQHTRL